MSSLCLKGKYKTDLVRRSLEYLNEDSDYRLGHAGGCTDGLFPRTAPDIHPGPNLYPTANLHTLPDSSASPYSDSATHLHPLAYTNDSTHANFHSYSNCDTLADKNASIDTKSDGNTTTGINTFPGSRAISHAAPHFDTFADPGPDCNTAAAANSLAAPRTNSAAADDGNT